MPTLLKRILFIAILLTIAYWIYRLIDKQWADDLKDNIVTTTQETAKSFGFDKDEIEEIFNPVIESSSESLWDATEIIYENNIVVSDPEIKEPVTTQPTTTKTNTTVKKTTTTSSSNILFQLFK
jgi:hypothetical protein